ncbi:MAG: ATP-dependent DNA ligase [Thermoplasmata archaeon]
MMETPFSELVEVCNSLLSTRKRLEKRKILAEFLSTLRKEEMSPAVLLIIGRIFPETDARALHVGWSTVKKALGPGKQTTLFEKPLSILDVQRSFDEVAVVSGRDSVSRRRNLIKSLLGRATDKEREIILKNLFREMRHGVSEGVMLEAIADVSGADIDLVRSAHMLSGDIGGVAEVGLTSGPSGLESFGLNLLNPVKPMLGELAENLEDVFKKHSAGTALEFKYDGARIQIHRDAGEIRTFTRRLADVTPSLPEIQEIALNLPAKQFLLDGEVVAVDEEGRPLPFQDLMRRFRRVHDVEDMKSQMPLKLYLFDILYLDGRVLIDEPYESRWESLSKLAPDFLAERMVTSELEEAVEFLEKALEAGHEGLMAKALDSHYRPGHRGKRWFKVKPAERLDLIIVAAEWGYGRREGWLSNYHLAVKNEETGGFEMIGKTFKGLTDEEFEWMTERLVSLKTSEDIHMVHVRPEVVVEVAYNEVQKSPRYESGFALRFARIKRIREDKSLEDIDTFSTLVSLYEKQFERKGRVPD